MRAFARTKGIEGVSDDRLAAAGACSAFVHLVNVAEDDEFENHMRSLQQKESSLVGPVEKNFERELDKWKLKKLEMLLRNMRDVGKSTMQVVQKQDTTGTIERGEEGFIPACLTI
jgi:hypothetical protein